MLHKNASDDRSILYLICDMIEEIYYLFSQRKILILCKFINIYAIAK